MRRRDLMLLLGGAVSLPRDLRAQQRAMRVIGFLGSTSPGPYTPFLAAFREGLHDSGYVEGQNVAIEYRSAEGRHDRLPALATDLVGRKVDVIVVGGTTAVQAAKKRNLHNPDRLQRSRPGRIRLDRQSGAAGR
jgi:putative tryptophan/tyrosine transport system substrate-binding protein